MKKNDGGKLLALQRRRKGHDKLEKDEEGKRMREWRRRREEGITG